MYGQVQEQILLFQMMDNTPFLNFPLMKSCFNNYGRIKKTSEGAWSGGVRHQLLVTPTGSSCDSHSWWIVLDGNTPATIFHSVWTLIGVGFSLCP
jgi:hypothetical protein